MKKETLSQTIKAARRYTRAATKLEERVERLDKNDPRESDMLHIDISFARDLHETRGLAKELGILLRKLMAER